MGQTQEEDEWHSDSKRPRVWLRKQIETSQGRDDQRMERKNVGKNGGLRRWRDATGCNNPGETFSARQMSGRQVLVKVKHRVYQGEAYDEVDSVAKVQ